MPTPYERLDRIIRANIPSEVIFKVTKSQGQQVFLEGVVTKPRKIQELDDDKELQLILEKEIEEQWDADAGKYYMNASVEGLWSTIKRTILKEYDNISTRCAATKRKTEQFIRDINLDDKHLPNYLIQVFMKVRSPAYDAMTTSECEALFEQFESLRRTYGKRNR